MARFNFRATPIAGLVLVERQHQEDSRGFLSRLYCAEEFREIGVRAPISQINHTLTRRKGTVRGMHYQLPPHAEIKLVSCLQGEFFDIAVNLQKELVHLSELAWRNSLGRQPAQLVDPRRFCPWLPDPKQ